MSGGQTVFAPALAAMEQALAGGGPVIIAVDGRCGSGKTTLAALASSELGLSVAHMDDFYLPHGRRVPDWRTTPCANMDFDRLREQVLCPYRQGSSTGPTGARRASLARRRCFRRTGRCWWREAIPTTRLWPGITI